MVTKISAKLEWKSLVSARSRFWPRMVDFYERLTDAAKRSRYSLACLHARAHMDSITFDPMEVARTRG